MAGRPAAPVHRAAPAVAAGRADPALGPLPGAACAAAERGLSHGPLEGVLGYHVAQAAVVTSITFQRHVGDPLGLRKVEYSLLLMLLANGPQTPKRLGHALVLTAPNLTLLLDRLQERGLILRERSTTDRRSQNVRLTAEGERLARRGVEVIPAMEAELIGERLTPVERLMLIELLRKACGR